MKLLNKPLCIDDFGNEVYLCKHTKRPVHVGQHVIVGEIAPNVSGSHVCAQDYREEWLKSRKLFDEMDANCNTCKNFERTLSVRGGHIKGICGKTHASLTIYPQDHMGMDCWEARV